jgi:hypothetical protein
LNAALAHYPLAIPFRMQSMLKFHTITKVIAFVLDAFKKVFLKINKTGHCSVFNG